MPIASKTIAMPPTHASKIALSESYDSRPKKLLRVGPVQSSLLDDEGDDELVDCFGIGGPPVPPSDDVIRSSSLWNVRDHNIRMLPSFHPLEKSSVFVPQASASIITFRIATVLQARSIDASYDAQNAKADCVSELRVEFRIRLYRGRGEECRHGIIVEVQRRAGFDLSYARDVYAILDAVQGKSVNDHAEEDEPILCKSANNASGSDEVIIGILEKPRMLASLQGISKTVCPSGHGAERVTTNSCRLPKASVVSCTSMDFMRRVALPVTNKLSASKKYFDLRRRAISDVGQSHDRPQHTTTKPLKTLTARKA